MLHIYNKKKLDYFKKIVKGHYNDEIADLYNKKFNENITPMQVKCLKRTYNLKSNVKQLNNIRYKTRFNTGSPIGTERKHQGYIEIKVKQPDKWVKKHIYIYEKVYGKIPKGKCLLFKDGNKMNCSLDNLILIDRNILYIANKNHLKLNMGEEILKTNILLSKLIRKIKINKNEKEIL